VLREELYKMLDEALCKILADVFKQNDIQTGDISLSQVFDWDILVSMATDLFMRIMEQNSKVWTDVKEYLEEHLPLYSVVDIRNKSAYPEDNYLFMVSAKKEDGSYAVWTCWNQQTKSLNHGHYGLKNHDECVKIFEEYFIEQNH